MYWLKPAPAVGFQWLPWKQGPYVTPWGGVAIGAAKHGEARMGIGRCRSPRLGSCLGCTSGTNSRCDSEGVLKCARYGPPDPAAACCSRPS